MFYLAWSAVSKSYFFLARIGTFYGFESYKTMTIRRKTEFRIVCVGARSFLVLYPLGVYGEMRVIYDVLAVVEKDNTLSMALPKPYNFSFSFAAFLKVGFISCHLLVGIPRHPGCPNVIPVGPHRSIQTYAETKK